MEIDKTLIPNEWYLYNDVHGTMLIQFQYKVEANHDIDAGQDTYVFEVFECSLWVHMYHFPLFVILSKIEQGQLRQVKVNMIFMELFK